MAQQQKILVIDDEPGICEMMELVLQFNGHEVLIIEKADDAENIILKNDIDLVILDMLISGVNGTDVCKRFRKNSDAQIARIPILMMSALHGAEEKCKKAGANDFLAKPFDVDNLLLKVESLAKA